MSASEWNAVWLSLQVGLMAATGALPLAIVVGYALARWPSSFRWILETIVNLPLVLPPVVTGYLLLWALAPQGPIGAALQRSWGVKIVFTWWAAVLAGMVMSFPLAVRAMRLAFEGVDPRLESAARTLGASRLTAFLTVTLPLARRGVIAGWILAFARSLGEFGATIMVAGNIAGQTRTIPLAIFTLANQPGGFDRTWPLVGVSVLLACGALAASEILERRQSRYASS
ncbi:MAG: molybdate ABC transporter permease subunit [Planctomycetota bacterium]